MALSRPRQYSIEVGGTAANRSMLGRRGTHSKCPAHRNGRLPLKRSAPTTNPVDFNDGREYPGGQVDQPTPPRKPGRRPCPGEVNC
jgi:hypothetical protein